MTNKPAKKHKRTPTPTPDDIETMLAGIREGTDPFLRWCKLDDEAEQAGGTLAAHRKPMAYEGTLYRAETIDPAGLCGQYWGMGTTPVAAAASAWVSACLGELWWQMELSDEEYADIQREVPAGWKFVLYGVPDRKSLT